MLKLEHTKRFYGWWITAAAFVTSGLAVGVPYYNVPFFYDYFERACGWSRSQITLGFPLAALLTIWMGPLLVPRFSPRKLIVAGSALTALALAGFARMGSDLTVYYALWIVFTAGYMFSGPIPHQLIVSHWFRRNRGKAMGIVYVGNGLMGSVGSLLVQPLTARFGFRTALVTLAVIVMICWPVAILFLRDKPSDVGQFPDGDRVEPAEAAVDSLSFASLVRNYSFFLLLIGSFCAIGAVGAINFHMKFVFLDQGFAKGAIADSTWRTASVLILWSSVIGRLAVGALADRFPKKWVMTATFALVAATIPNLLLVRPGHVGLLYTFAVLFGFGLGADYMLIPLMAAEQFGINSLSRAMAVILPVNTIGQTWLPYLVSILRDRTGSYSVAMGVVLAVAAAGAVAIAILPRKQEWQRKT
jgi:Na+/melibiose symporter-like transporter